MSLRSAIRRGPPPVPSLDGRLCLVTGAGSGIGRATATAAARAGARVVLTDINAAGLERTVAELGDAVAVHRALDITDLEAVRGLAEEVHATVGTLDVAINVAGIATWGAVERLTEQDWRRTVEVNLMGPIHVVECFVPAIVRAGRGGQLVNVASAAGLLALPWHAPYSASKFGLRGVSEVLRFDLHRHRIGVTLVCPGGVDTPLVETVRVAGIDPAAMLASPHTRRFRRHAVSAESVAERILAGITSNRYLVYTSADIRALHLLERIAPPVYALAMRVSNEVFVTQLERLAARGQND